MMKNFFGLKIMVVIVFVAITVSILAISFHDTVEANNVNSSDTIPKAVIIDQLYDDTQNKWFHEKASEFLEGAGYQVDIFTTKDITVDFYKKLPLQNYKFVIVRSHGAADENAQNSVTLFTGEKYVTDKYISEQLFGQIKKGAPLQEVNFFTNGSGSQWVIVNDTYSTLTMPANVITSSKEEYFLITPAFVETGMEGKFSQTIFVLGGCSTMNTDSMAQSLIRRGASSIVGWDDTIGSVDNDFAILSLLDRLLDNNMKMEDAVDSVMNDIPIDRMKYPARLKVYSEGI